MTANDENKIDALLANLWERGLPVLQERLDILDRAARAASLGELTEASRLEAAGLAHKLSGTLGMFGYDRGTEIAREIEQLLATPPAASGRLATLVSELRETLQIQSF